MTISTPIIRQTSRWFNIKTAWIHAVFNSLQDRDTGDAVAFIKAHNPYPLSGST